MSHQSASLAEKMGYTDVKVFEGGYPEWQKIAGADKSVQIKGGSEEGSIDLAVFKQILAENPDTVLLIDVRDPDEYATGHFKTAVNIPSDLLAAKLKTMQADKPIIFVCSTGARSGEAYYMVQDIRPDIKKVYYVEATVTYKPDGTFDLKRSN
ncbi:MAG: rhodanese-like domain-containing protein [bacterium]